MRSESPTAPGSPHAHTASDLSSSSIKAAGDSDGMRSKGNGREAVSRPVHSLRPRTARREFGSDLESGGGVVILGVDRASIRCEKTVASVVAG
jgi:hypothetical protein